MIDSVLDGPDEGLEEGLSLLKLRLELGKEDGLKEGLSLLLIIDGISDGPDEGLFEGKLLSCKDGELDGANEGSSE